MKIRKFRSSSPAAYMIGFSLVFFSLFFIFSFPYPQSSHGNTVNAVPKAEEARNKHVQQAYGNLPLSFIQNDGQLNKKVKFYEKAGGRTTFFTEEGVHLSMTNGQSSSANSPALIKLKPLEANKHSKITAEGMQEGKVNYFIGNDPKRWKTNIPTYQAVVYKEIYPGIDIKFYGSNKQMEYDIIVKPGADPSKAKFSYEGIETLHLTASGDLEIGLSGGKIVQKKPIVYQMIDGKRIDLSGTLKIQPIADRNTKRFTYGFKVASYDKTYPLVIDPILVYSTYLGGSERDRGAGIAVDALGNAYVTGSTLSTNFPTTPGAFQAVNGGVIFVTKLDAAGSALVYSTYLGGSDYDTANGIAVDASGNAYVTGYTSSANFPTTPGAFQTANAGNEDAFVTKLSASGSALVYSTYLGGSDGAAGSAIALDIAGEAYVVGGTRSTNFPTTPGAFQMTNPSFGSRNAIFVAKVNAAGSALVYSTYLGGSSDDGSNAIAVDALGNAYVTGDTQSSDFPTANPFQAVFGGFIDAFVTKLNPAGSALVYSTYLGGSNSDVGRSIAVDSAGNAYIMGDTTSTDFPTASPFQAANAGEDDTFVTKLNAAGSALIYSTYLGGSNRDFALGIGLDPSGNAYVTGVTSSTNFPTVSPLQAANAGSWDVFVTKLNQTGSALVYSTYLGGSGDEYYMGKAAIAVDASGNAYVTGQTQSSNFPTTPGAFQATNAGDFDAFVAKIGEPPTTTTTTTTSTTTNTVTSTTTTILTTTSTSTTTTTLKKCKDQGKGKDKNKCKDKFKDKEKINMKEKDTSLPFSKN